MKKAKGIAVAQRIEAGNFTRPDLVEGLFLRAFREYEGQRVEVRIIPANRTRSLSQNAYYWGVVVLAVKELFQTVGHNHTEETIHEFLKVRFLGNSKIIDPETGKILIIPPSTAKLTKDEFGEYLDRIIEWSEEFFGATIPVPDTENQIYPIL